MENDLSHKRQILGYISSLIFDILIDNECQIWVFLASHEFQMVPAVWGHETRLILCQTVFVRFWIDQQSPDFSLNGGYVC